ncbi:MULTISPECIES: hypothetical protein [Streptomyces]|uniref:hypothetical protein n=1 Tax=Streptomyces TaxID=1883 RepID=UPI002F93AAFC
MKRSMLRALAGAVLAGAALATPAALGAAEASAAAAVRADGSVQSRAAAWAAPNGYTREGFAGLPSACEARGRAGVADGSWTAYVCHRDLPFSAFVNLYVKK